MKAARATQEEWAERTAVARGELVREIALALREWREELSAAVVDVYSEWKYVNLISDPAKV